MKRTILPLLLGFFALVLPAQKQVEVKLIQKSGASEFTLKDAFTATDGYLYKPSRLQYYVSMPSVIHDGGQLTPSPNQHLLVSAEDGMNLNLGEMNVESIEGITFSIGVNIEHNHLDPASYPEGHPLAPQNPSMHWGWAAGYRFIAFEGKAGTNLVYSFDIHSIGNDLYKTISIPVEAKEEDGKLVIRLLADYNELLHNMDISGGLSAHGNLGGAATIMNNIQNRVFSALSPSSAHEMPGFSGSFSLSPNPAPAGLGQAVFDLPFPCQFRLCDLSGRQILEQNLPKGISTASINAPGPGLYIAQLWSEGRPVAVKKWAVY